MKKIVILIITAFLSLSANASVTLNDAEKKALNYVSNSLPKNYTLYRYPSALKKVTLPAGDVISLSTNCWVFFIDEAPGENWGHNCRYVFVSVSTGNVTQKQSNMFPRQLHNWNKRGDTRNAPNSVNTTDWGDSFQDNGLLRTNLFANYAKRTIPTDGEKYAVIISGGIDSNYNFVRYWNDCSMTYQILTKIYGYKKKNISTYIADGTDPAIDMSNGMSSPLDLDGDQKGDINGSATKSLILGKLDSLRRIMTEKDHLFIFTTDHGFYYPSRDANVQRGLCLWGNEELYPSELSNALRGNKGDINIVMEQCFSGCFIQPIESLGQNISIATAAHKNETSLGRTFSNAWLCAILGHDLDGEVTNADRDGDGIVSMEEAFIFAEENDLCRGVEHPQYWAFGGLNYGETVDYRTVYNYMGRVGKFGQYQFMGNKIGCDYSLPKERVETKTLSGVNNIIRSGWTLKSSQNISISNVEYVSKNNVILQKGFKYTPYTGRRLWIHTDKCTNSGLKSGIVNNFEYKESELIPSIIYVDTESTEEMLEPTAFFNVSPNPTEGVFKVSFNEELATITVYDMTGRVVRNYNNVTGDLEIDITNEPAGIYFVQVNERFSTKIVKM